MRNGKRIGLDEPLHEEKIKLCSRGLHASLSPKDARQYAPNNSVLTKVLVWGRIKLQKDKLVATDRKIFKEMK